MHESGGSTAIFPKIFGKYTLLSRLATGGMANVFLAQHKGPGGFEKTCVVKRILPHLSQDPEFIQLFLGEARMAARLSHPNIVQIYDLGQVDKDYFLAMEYVDGVDLEQTLYRAKEKGFPALPWPIASRIIADIAGALDHVHHAIDNNGQPLQLVHRDITPSNVIVSWNGSPKILDFGIATSQGTYISNGTIKGKVHYLSPEQLQSTHLDGRSDVFSLGIILYELIYGVRPFPGENLGQLTTQILHEEPQPPEKFNLSIPARLKLTVLRALAKSPAERWQTARHFQRALEQLLTEQHSPCTGYHVEAYLRKLFPDHVVESKTSFSTLDTIHKTGQILPADNSDRNPLSAANMSKVDTSATLKPTGVEGPSPHKSSKKILLSMIILVLIIVTGVGLYLGQKYWRDHRPAKILSPNLPPLPDKPLPAALPKTPPQTPPILPPVVPVTKPPLKVPTERIRVSPQRVRPVAPPAQQLPLPPHDAE